MIETLSRFRGRLLGLLSVAFVALGFVALPAGGASAQVVLPADPTGGAMDTIAQNLASWITNYGIPAIVLLLAVGTAANLLVRYVRKARSAGS